MTRFCRFGLPALLVLSLGACNFSVGYKKDLKTGLSYKYNGFRIDGVVVVDSAGNPLSTNKSAMQSRIALVFYGLSNFTPKDKKVFPGMKLSVTDKTGKAALEADDLFADGSGYPPESATQLRGDISIGSPMRAGETYHIKAHVWDKNKPDNTIDADMDLEVH